MSDKFSEENDNYKKITKAIKYIDEHFKEQPSINTICEYIGMSKYHFIRVFKEYVSLTPNQFLQSLTLNYAKEYVKESKSLLDSSLDLGLTSSSRLHDLFVNIMGVTPKEYKENGKNVDITYGYGSTPFGQALIAYTKRGISYLGFIDENKEDTVKRFNEVWSKARIIQNDLESQELLNQIFLNKKTNLNIKTANFQINIWKALLNIEDSQKNINTNSIIPFIKAISSSGVISDYKKI